MPGKTRRVPALGTWIAVCGGLVGLQIGTGFGAFGERTLGSATLLFWVVLVAASGCVVTSAAVLARAWRDDTAELGLHATFFMAVSVLPLVHGLTTPGVLYGPNDATMSAVQWGLPLACLAQAPLIAGRRTFGRVAPHWRRWAVAHIAVQVGIGAVLLVSPSALPWYPMGGLAAAVIALSALAASSAVSLRHLRLYGVSRHPGTLAVSFAYMAIGASHLVWVVGSPMNPAFWVAHVLDIGGVFAGTVVGFIAYRRGELERRVLQPLLVREPLDALELGLDPVVRRFMADLATKDQITHDHVARTAETAVCIGEVLGLSGPDLRTLGLGALLHDLGKLEIDDAILNKPGRLTAEEFDVIKTHTVIGERLAAQSTLLDDVRPIIRHHHERLDGQGYPDRLTGEEIPLLARVVSVCDAYDAMVHTRQYREGMGVEKAVAILREHAGSQWDPRVVDALLAVKDQGRIPEAPVVLADVGGQVGCSCTAELPPVLAGVSAAPDPHAPAQGLDEAPGLPRFRLVTADQRA